MQNMSAKFKGNSACRTRYIKCGPHFVSALYIVPRSCYSHVDMLMSFVVFFCHPNIFDKVLIQQ